MKQTAIRPPGAAGPGNASANARWLASVPISPDRIAAWLVFGELTCSGGPPNSPATRAATIADTNAAPMPAATKAGPSPWKYTTPQLSTIGSVTRAPTAPPPTSPQNPFNARNALSSHRLAPRWENWARGV